MTKIHLNDVTKSIRTYVVKHTPEILTGMGIAGMITTTVMAVKATPKALKILQDKWENEEDEEIIHSKNREDFTIWERVQLTWKCYIPAAITGSLSIFCLISANSVNSRRNSALAAAYSLSESALKGYREKVIETIGEKKEQTVKDSIAKDKIEQNPVSNREIIITDKGNALCYDVISGRYFKSDIEKIKKSINEINKNMLNQMYISLNDFYYELGLKSTKLGNDLGWNLDKGLVELNFSSQLTDDGTPCLVMDYTVAPKYDYYK